MLAAAQQLIDSHHRSFGSATGKQATPIRKPRLIETTTARRRQQNLIQVVAPQASATAPERSIETG
jgi:hypothetical protein